MKPFNKNKLRLLMAKLPQKIGKIALAHVMRNFSLQGFQDKVVEKWKKPANPTGRKILIDTGRMKAGFKIITAGLLVKIYNLVPYAVFHNKGPPNCPT
jgi:phage gpG-like protein